MIIVVAIDAALSDANQLALHAASSPLARSLQPTGVVLLHVILVPVMPKSRFGRSQFRPQDHLPAKHQMLLYSTCLYSNPYSNAGDKQRTLAMRSEHRTQE